MTRWSAGEAEIEQLLSAGELEHVRGAEADGRPWVQRAHETAAAAEQVTHPPSQFALAYDAARIACTGLLTHQGLRPTTKGGHYAVDLAVRAQFGAGVRSYSALRRRRNEIEYPSMTADADVDHAESQRAVKDSKQIITAAEQLLEHLSIF